MVDAVVEYDYEPNMSDELQLRVGDVIKDVKPMDGGWWEGALVGGGKRGLFPDNFVKIINNLESIPNGKSEEKKDNNSMKRETVHKRTCRVLFNYTPDQDDELALQENDIIECTGEVEDGWWKGTLNGKTGVFPSNFVEVVSSVKEEQQVADKNKRNKEFHHQPQVSKPSLDHLEPPLAKDSRIPKLPPKPVKEQCIVQFPYLAQNDDELSLIKGQILNIISKDSEDKGWWRGELDGKIGVFPDNFVKVVKVVNLQEISSGNKKSRAPSPNCDSGNFDKGSREKICSNQYHSHSESSPSKKGSFGKSNPPPKPKAPCPTKSSSNKPVSSAVNIGQPSRGSFLASFKPSLSKSSSSNRSSFSNSSVSHKSAVGGIMSSSPEQTPGSPSPKPLSKSLPNNIEEPPLDRLHSENQKSGKEFDGVSRSEKLAHPTADRVKGPKRRPPSSIFTKDVIALEDQNDDQNSDTIDPSTNDIERNNSSSSVKEIKDDAGNDDPDSEPIHRVKDESAIQNTNASLPNSKSSSPVNAFKEELQSRLENHSADSEVSQVKKPDWLEELSRKQANRKSGFFNDKVTGSRSSAPMILDKPQLPTKPSQIRDDIRKLNKRASHIETSGSSDKENNRPNRPSSIGDPSAHSDLNNSNTPASSVVPAEARNPRISDELESKSQPRKLPFSDKKSHNQESDEDHQSLVQRVAKLESALIMYSERLQILEESVKEERDLRLKLQEELDELRK